MSTEIQLAQQLSMREAGLNEYWLQDQIYENPACLGLGELEAVEKERAQSSGGRLDILLKDPETESMYEVEVMLGETDETHIIRTIEYWDREKRRWPQRQHFAVLVAEHVNKRFFDVVHLLSYSIPIIAVQAALIQSSDRRSLYFSKILDLYEEPDDGITEGDGTYNRDYWLKRAPWTLEAAEALLRATSGNLASPTLNYLKHYVAIEVSGYNYFWFHKRTQQKSLFGFRISSSLQDEVSSLLDAAKISYKKQSKKIYFTTDKQMIEENGDVFRTLTGLVKRTWQKD